MELFFLQINKQDHSWNVAQEQKRLIQLAKHDAEILGSSNDLEIASEFLPLFLSLMTMIVNFIVFKSQLWILYSSKTSI